MSNCLQPTSNCNCGCQPCPTYAPCPYPSIIRCGNNGGTTPIPAAVAPNTAITIATVSIDTSALCNPQIKIDFASNMVATAVTSATFQIFKICGSNTKVPVSGTWTFAAAPTPTAAAPLTTTFNFFVCECGTCPTGCCTYTVDVINSSGAVGAASTITVNNAILSVQAFGSTC